MTELQNLASPGQKKHLPEIEAPERVKKGKNFDFRILVKRDLTSPRQIDPERFWITVYFLPQESRIPYRVVRPLFSTQKEPEKETDPRKNPFLYQGSFQYKTEEAGNIYAAAYCPTHGLSQSKTHVDVV
jgi:desulfoferrodoxin (superoxide reductase-like protein)